MKLNKSHLILGAAIAGFLGASTQGIPAFAKDKAMDKAEAGLCKGANACGGKGACGEAKGKNECKGHGSAMMTKAACDKKKMTWMPAPKMEEKM